MDDDFDEQRKQEHKLLILARAGDREAWASLLRPIRLRLLQAIRKIVKNAQEAEDLVQETLFTMYSEMNRFRGESRLYTWAWRVAQRDALNLLRDEATHRERLREHTAMDASVWSPGMGAPTPTPENLAVGRESLLMANKAFGQLKTNEQTIILAAFENDEATDPAMGSTERVALHRARQKLKLEMWLLTGKEDDR
jgi:RNA polymerase sigma-70 factor (ECF subfamily)